MTIYLVCNHVKQESYMHNNQITTSKVKGGRLPIYTQGKKIQEVPTSIAKLQVNV